MICTENLLEKMHILMEFSAIINSTLDTSHVRERAIRAACQLLQADAGSLLLVDAETDELFFEVATGEQGEKLKEIRLQAGEGIAGWVVQHGEAVIINDVQNDSRFYRSADSTSSYETRSMVAAPVSVGLSVFCKQLINTTTVLPRKTVISWCRWRTRLALRLRMLECMKR